MAETDGVEVGLPWHLVQTVEVIVVRIVETVVPISVDVVPSVVWTEVNGQVVVNSVTTTVV